jgi:hypothetical protein
MPVSDCLPNDACKRLLTKRQSMIKHARCLQQF